MPKTPGRLAREAAAREQAEREAQFQYRQPIGPRWDDRLGSPLDYAERQAARQRGLAEIAAERDRKRRERELRLATRIEKPTSIAHFVPGRYERDVFGRGHWCKHCGTSVSDRTLHDQHHLRSTPGAGVIMFLETLEALFGE